MAQPVLGMCKTWVPAQHQGRQINKKGVLMSALPTYRCSFQSFSEKGYPFLNDVFVENACADQILDSLFILLMWVYHLFAL